MADDPTHYDRPGSPSPSVSPTVAISAVPHLDRSVSTASSVSSVSGRSVSDGGIAGRRRGYVRPQATVFADSARNRESVMSLGSIAHLQYYFARTGLLDGKGGQLAKDRKRSAGSTGRSVSGSSDAASLYLSTSPEGGLAYAVPDNGFSLDGGYTGGGFAESPVEKDEMTNDWGYQEPIMLPPTVSTYNHRPAYVPPPPDMTVLRRELREALDDARKVLYEADFTPNSTSDRPYQADGSSSSSPEASESQGWHEIQGLHLLDLVTLAIRAAKNYYTAHEQPQQLYSIKSERQIRSELYHVLDVLKRIAARNFSGGTRPSERESIFSWIASINDLLSTEEERERAEQEDRDSWQWREGDWAGREREREWLFLKSFDKGSDDLPVWTEPSDELPTPFLSAMQTGLQLVMLHNELVRKSKRQFEEIKVYHTDTAKPYRCAENLRYWIKAAQLRWEIKLEIDVMGVVRNTGSTAWKGFDEALLEWCRGVRKEITAEWQEQRKLSLAKPPTLRLDRDILDGIGVPI